MIRVKFPFAVCHDGIDYAAGEVFEVDSPDTLAVGATILEPVAQAQNAEAEPVQRPARRSKAAKQAD